MEGNSVSDNSVLRISGLSFAYEAPKNQPRPWTIKDLSLSIKAGEIVSILGASGSGKSTLLNLIAGLLAPQEGTIEISAKEKSKQQIGYIFQQDALFPWNTVEANIMLATKLNTGISKQAAREKMDYYLRAFHLKEQILKSYPAQLSGGMRQRVSIIQSLMFEPQLLLLDEPFSALDFYTKLRLESEFYGLIKEKKNAAIFVTHDIEEAIAVSDRIWIMSKEGTLTKEFSTGSKSPDYLPENARGTTEFAELYQAIWSDLKTVIAE